MSGTLDENSEEYKAILDNFEAYTAEVRWIFTDLVKNYLPARATGILATRGKDSLIACDIESCYPGGCTGDIWDDITHIAEHGKMITDDLKPNPDYHAEIEENYNTDYDYIILNDTKVKYHHAGVEEFEILFRMARQRNG